MAGVDSQLVDELLSGQLDLLRFEAGTRVRILTILTRLQRELTTKLAQQDLTTFNKERTQTLLKSANDLIDRYYTIASGELDASLRAVAETASTHAAQSMQAAAIIDIGAAGLPTETFLARVAMNTLIFGAKTEEWWSRQQQDTSFRFANAVRQGMVQGETNEQIVARITGSPRLGKPGIMDVSRSNARSLVHSSIQAVANEARLETFRKNSDVVTGVRQLSTLDSHTTEICIAYSGQEWDLITEKPLPGSKLPFNGGPPRHWGCRSILVPITKTFKSLGLDVKEPKPGERASTAGPVGARTSFAQFLERKGKEFQDEVLGPGRAELWRKGKITLTQLLDLRGNPLTLAQLQRKYA